MLLSNLRRLRAACGGQGTPITDNVANNRSLTLWLTAVSDQIEKYLNRELHIESRTEYFDPCFGQNEFFIKASPVVSITSVYEDSSGLYTDGNEVEDCHVGSKGNSIVLPFTFEDTNPRGLRIIYVGGLAYNAAQSTFAIASVVGSWAAGKVVRGASSGAVGYVVSQTATAMVVEVYYGIFESGETLQQFDAEDFTATPTVTAVLSSITNRSLAEIAPAIVSACEAQVRYCWAHSLDFENSGSDRMGGTVRRQNPTVMPYSLQTEALTLLQSYRNL